MNLQYPKYPKIELFDLSWEKVCLEVFGPKWDQNGTEMKFFKFYEK